ncbi:hypothetical protein [Streptomyces fagopyri]|uniref:hypothetical protein n=1 Tax=Streptomyces fagopyri TaxID=2662397 RepID=UPI00372106DD
MGEPDSGSVLAVINRTASTGSSPVDGEDQADFARVRGERLARLKVRPDMSECGAR